LKMAAHPSCALSPVCKAPGVHRRRRERSTPRKCVTFGRVTSYRSRRAHVSTLVPRAGEDLAKPPLAEPDASIEPCLVGWTDVDDNGVDVYCCEQPGGAIQCKTIAADPEHEECELMEQIDGSLDVSCDEDDEPMEKPATKPR